MKLDSAVMLNVALCYTCRAYPQVLMSLVMMVPFLCMLTLRQAEPPPDHRHDHHHQQWPSVNEQVGLRNFTPVPLSNLCM